MVRILNGKRYNTATATLIAEAEADCPRDNFGYWHEQLYQTKKSAWFLAGAGGANGSWSRSVSSQDRSAGHGIEVLTESQALRWCEERGIDPDIVSEHFEIEDA